MEMASAGIQDILFELMRRTTFNSFDGERVVQYLREHSDLWEAALMKRNDLIPLRDLPKNVWNVDTLYLTPIPGKEKALLDLVTRHFAADDIYWIGGKEAANLLGATAMGAEKQVLVAWWD